MSDGYGTLELPVPVPAATLPIKNVDDLSGEVVGDPCLGLLLAYAKAVLNRYCGQAWAAIAPGDGQVVQVANPWNPERDGFRDTVLPALFGYRAASKPPHYDAVDWRMFDSQVLLVWVFPLQDQFKSQIRNNIVNALAKTLDAALIATRDPAFVASTDADPTAPSYDAEPLAVKLTVATTTGSATYTGAALDGARGGGPYGVPRGVTITLGGSPSSFVNGSQIRVTGTDVLGNATTQTLTIDTSRIPGTLYTTQALGSVTQVDRDAQAGTAGTMAVGLRAHQGQGTELCAFGSIDFELARDAVWRPQKIPLAGGGMRLYPAVEFAVRVLEKRTVNLTRFPEAGVGIDQFGDPATGAENTTVITNPDGVVLASANFP